MKFAKKIEKCCGKGLCPCAETVVFTPMKNVWIELLTGSILFLKKSNGGSLWKLCMTVSRT